MAAVNSLTGNGSRFGSSTSLNSSKESKQAAREWKKTLLQSEEEGQRSEWQGEEDDDGEHDGLGPEVKHALGGSSSGGQGLFTDAMLQDHNPEDRRDSMGRMAAAFVSQPGAFSIQTLPFRPEDMSSQEGETIPSDLLVKGVEKPVPLPYNPLFSPSAPMSVDLTHQPRNHTRTVSASAALQQRGNRAHHFAVRANSAHALQEQSTDQSHGRRAPRTRGATSVSSHALALLSPSILLHSQALGPNPSSPSMIAEFQDLVSPLARSEPGSPQRSPIGKRASPTNRHYRRLTSSSRTLNAPFQSGNNYSIPGFSPSQPSFPATPMTTGHAQELPHTYQQLHHYQHHYQHQHQPSQHSQNQWSSWFNRKRHSRNPSRATMASCPPFSVPLGGVNPPSPLLEAIGESTSQLTTEHLQDFTKPIYEGTNTSSVDHSNNTTLIGTGTGTGGSEPSQGMVSEAISPYLYHRRHISSVASMNLCQERDRERDMHDRDPQEPWLPPVPPTATPSSPPPLPTPLTATGFQLPQYRTDTALALWGLRAIPSWIPLSSLKIAWSSLAILVLTIGGTIVYDFVQLGLGNDLVSGS
ncbi:hypothetical protein BGW38_007702 [Lunasporangiospora selenospora]|uniref:Uncharacterized protein n=1 Tax=Lunasporangiospora selenospora TaxID=979761 RepID=A0A9P6FL59_9FUNG|nr:hypothetical protein BGW38_007702 [Lunasporangiospora selenospora]